jgi:hypothetical protein
VCHWIRCVSAFLLRTPTTLPVDERNYLEITFSVDRINSKVGSKNKKHKIITVRDRFLNRRDRLKSPL